LTQDIRVKLLLTGATGFIGSQLAHRLVAEGYELAILVRPDSRLDVLQAVLPKIQVHVYDGSYASLQRAMKDAKPSLVCHLASLVLAQHRPEDVAHLIESNLNFPCQLLEAMNHIGVKHLLNTGTSWQHFQNESYNPVNLYASTKQAFEAILEYYVQARGIKAITLKLFDTYGPNDPRPKLIHLLNKAATTTEPLDMSAGEQLIDLVHIEDVTEAYVIAAQRLLDGQVSQHERYAVSSGKLMPLKELVHLYSEVTKQAITVNWGARPYRDREVMEPWNKGLSLPNWAPKIDLFDSSPKSHQQDLA
jgi:nucleoside-diphosphate-sugar epimerase